MDYTKGELKLAVMAGGTDGVFESYRAAIHKGLNISQDKILEVEARILHPKPAKDEKDIQRAMQDWQYDKRWLIEAGQRESVESLSRHNATILLAMMPADGHNSMHRYLREIQSSAKFSEYAAFEEEMWAELTRREKTKDKPRVDP